MILLDTHILLWWMDESPRLSDRHRQLIEASQSDAVLYSAISIWEAALLASKGRISLRTSPNQWLDDLLGDEILEIAPMSPQTLVASTMLPGDFHSDPADRIIVATARGLGAELLTVDQKILAYSDVKAVGP